MKKHHYIFAVSIVLSLIFACNTNKMQKDGGKLLASVYDKELYLSDLEGMIPENSSEEDSTLIINAFIERWARDAALMNEAELALPKNLNIDKLVNDYRSSLIRHNYEKLLIEQLLDSTITQQKYAEFYEENKDYYHLDAPIIRCHFLKYPKSAPELNELKKWWKDYSPDQSDALKEHANKYAAIQLLNDSTWYKLDNVIMELPEGNMFEKILKGEKDFSKEDDKFVYFLRVLEMIKKNEIAPFSYIKDQASKVILHKRKMKLLDEKKNDIYERALRKNNVQILSN